MPVNIGYIGLVVKNHQHSSAIGDGGVLNRNNTVVDVETLLNFVLTYASALGK